MHKDTYFLLFTYNKILFKWKERMECLEVLRRIIFPNKYAAVLRWKLDKFVCRNMCTCWFVWYPFVVIVVWAITLDFKKRLTSLFGTFFFVVYTPLSTTKSTNLIAIYSAPQYMAPNMYSHVFYFYFFVADLAFFQNVSNIFYVWWAIGRVLLKCNSNI